MSFLKGLFKKKPGGTFVGNLLRDLTGTIKEGIFHPAGTGPYPNGAPNTNTIGGGFGLGGIFSGGGGKPPIPTGVNQIPFEAFKGLKPSTAHQAQQVGSNYFNQAAAASQGPQPYQPQGNDTGKYIMYGVGAYLAGKMLKLW